MGRLPIRRGVFALGVGAAVLCGTAQADSLIVTSDRDNTLYEDSGGFLSNGSGTGFFAGTTSSMQIRRGLVRFDVSAIPTGSTIAGVSMRLRMNRTIAGAQIVSLRRVTADWGEGISDAGDPGGGGSAAEPGDATWIHTFYDTQFWTNSGGDFSGVVSASTNVAGTGFYTWNGAGMVADVQSWVSGANTNYGWILIGNETAAGTTKRFASHEAPAESDWPLLTIEYTPPQYAVGDMNCDGRVDNFDIDPFVTALTDPDGYAAQYPNCDPLNADINQDGVVNNFDIDPFVALLTGG